MRITKLVTLIAVAVVAGACSGSSPTAPTASMPGDETASFDAKAVAGPTPTQCRVTEVQLRLLPTPGAAKVSVRATYLWRGQSTKCSVAPVWDSQPADRLNPTKDPFIVSVTRSLSTRPVMVLAQAPNGVKGTILVK